MTHAMSGLRTSGEVFSGLTPLAGLSAVCDLGVRLLCVAQVRIVKVVSGMICGAHQMCGAAHLQNARPRPLTLASMCDGLLRLRDVINVRGLSYGALSIRYLVSMDCPVSLRIF